MSAPVAYVIPRFVRALVLLGASVLLGLCAIVALVLFGGPKSIVTVRTARGFAIEDCGILVQSEFWLDEVRHLHQLAPGTSTPLRFHRLDESDFIINCRLSDGRMVEGSTGNFWDPSPGDTIVLELSKEGYAVMIPGFDSTGVCAWSPPRRD